MHSTLTNLQSMLTTASLCVSFSISGMSSYPQNNNNSNGPIHVIHNITQNKDEKIQI